MFYTLLKKCNIGVTQLAEFAAFNCTVRGSIPLTGIMEGDTAHGAIQVEFPSGQRGQT